MDGVPLNSKQGRQLFCAAPLNDVRVQEQCITAIMMRANVQQLDGAGMGWAFGAEHPSELGKNLLIEKEHNGKASRITIFDFDISTIDGFFGHGIKPAIGELPDARSNGTKTEGLLSGLHRHMCGKNSTPYNHVSSIMLWRTKMEFAIAGASLVILLAAGHFVLEHCMRRKRRVRAVELQSR